MAFCWFLPIFLQALSALQPLPNTQPLQKPATITLIFENVPAPDKRLPLAGGRSMSVGGETLVYTDQGKAHVLSRRYGQIDTVVITPTSEVLRLTHRYHVISSFDYLLRKGDIVSFTYQEGVPTATVLNRLTQPFELNYEQQVRQRFFGRQPYTSQEVYDNPIVELDWAQDFQAQIKAIKQRNHLQVQQYLRQELSLLDSLHTQPGFSLYTYSYFQAKAKNRQQYQALVEQQLTRAQVVAYIRAHTIGPLADLTEGFYASFLRNVAQLFYVNTAPRLELGPHQFIYDYRQAYDSIAVSPLFPNALRNRLLAEQVDNIAGYFSQSDFQHYFNKFVQDVPDTALVRVLRNKYVLDFDKLRSETGEVHLMKLGKQKTTLAQVLQQHRGKKIYVDFWASWCGPCRQSMPASVRLRSKHRDALVVYLSIDQSYDAWKKAALAEHLQYYKYSYLIINPRTAAYLARLQVKTIPRYLLFDSTGKLIHQNAPGPDSKELAGLLH